MEEGVLPLKVKDEVVLKDWVHAIVIPEACRSQTIEHIPDTLSGKVHYIANDTRDIWQWSEKVYEYVKRLPGSNERQTRNADMLEHITPCRLRHSISLS